MLVRFVRLSHSGEEVIFVNPAHVVRLDTTYRQGGTGTQINLVDESFILLGQDIDTVAAMLGYVPPRGKETARPLTAEYMLSADGSHTHKRGEPCARCGVSYAEPA